ncbi:MAG: hypothetical protein R2698_05170 [Microthrixaceae bacterium]
MVTDPEDPVSDVDLWATVPDHDGTVVRLRRVAMHRTHAYLFVGRPGYGTRAAARAFAADLLSEAASPEEAVRHRRLCAQDRHPSVIVLERKGAAITVDQAREVVRAAQMRPPEGSVQVIVLTEFHLVSAAAPTLLKSIEEPPPGTVFIVLADEVTPELTTIASRCSRFDFGPVPPGVVIERLVASGVDRSRAEAAATASAGDLERAVLLASDDGVLARRDRWRAIPTLLDGTGATAARLVGEVTGSLDEVLKPLSGVHERELEQFRADAERLGRPVGARKEVEARHNRERRRVRSDELRAGLAALLDGYRADVAGSPSAYVEAGERVNELCDRLVFNVDEELALLDLFLGLPRR